MDGWRLVVGIIACLILALLVWLWPSVADVSMEIPWRMRALAIVGVLLMLLMLVISGLLLVVSWTED